MQIQLRMNDGSLYSSAEGAEIQKIDDTFLVVSRALDVTDCRTLALLSLAHTVLAASISPLPSSALITQPTRSRSSTSWPLILPVKRTAFLSRPRTAALAQMDRIM